MGLKSLVVWSAMVATGTTGGIFAYGDTVGDLLLVAGHRFKNAGTAVQNDGSVSLIALEQLDARRREQAAREDADRLAQAETELRAAELARRSLPQSRGRRR